MLVLTRKRGEAITIGSDIRVVVLQTKGGQVRLGVEAPRAVEVHRDEVYSRIRDENHLAASANVAAHNDFARFRLRAALGGKGQRNGKKLVRIT
jgi:carbon storage regulator